MAEKTEKVRTAQGPRPSGRPKGLSQLPTRERNRLIAQTKVKPLSVLLDTMAERWEAANAAKNPKARAKLQNEACAVAEKVAPYLHPKLQATTLKGEGENPLKFVLTLPSAVELREAVRGTTDEDKPKG